MKKELIKALMIAGLTITAVPAFPPNSLAEACYDYQCIRSSGTETFFVENGSEIWTIYNPDANIKNVTITVSTGFSLRGKSYKAGTLTFRLNQYESTKITFFGTNEMVTVDTSMSIYK